MQTKNYYTVLGVNKNAEADEIRAAYRKLAKKYHPDLNPGNSAAEAKMREISEAWETLGDSEKRKKYDDELSGRNAKTNKTGKSTAPVSSRPMTQEDFMNMSKSFDNMFSTESIKNSINQNRNRQKSDNTIFEQFMGFKPPVKK